MIAEFKKHSCFLVFNGYDFHITYLINLLAPELFF